MFRSICRFLKDEDGPTSVEYCVLLMLVLVVVIMAVQLFGLAVSGSLQDSSDKLGDSF